MSEYEIFNNDDEGIKIVPDIKKPRRARKPITVKEKTEKIERTCPIKELVTLSTLPVFLAGLAIFFALFVKFLPLAFLTTAAIKASAAFFFISFGLAFSSLVVEVINMIKEKSFIFNLKILLICLAFFVVMLSAV